MWSYYGRKQKIVNSYPIPIHSIIVEPFAGSAAYSLKYFERDIILIDKYEVVIKLWKYLQQATEKDILSLPEIENGKDLRELNEYKYLVEEEKYLIGFCMNNGSAIPKNVSGRMNFNSWKRDQKRIAKDLFKIKHWKIIHGEYNCIKNIQATYFIDPPYQYGGKYYKEQFNDYKSLKEYIITRNGQVIACENSKADWLDFKPLKEINGQLHKTMEVIYIRNGNEHN